MMTTDSPRFSDLFSAVSSLVGDDGTGDLGIIVRQALNDDPSATVDDIAAIVREAREDAAAERLRGEVE